MMGSVGPAGGPAPSGQLGSCVPGLADPHPVVGIEDSHRPDLHSSRMKRRAERITSMGVVDWVVIVSVLIVVVVLAAAAIPPRK